MLRCGRISAQRPEALQTSTAKQAECPIPPVTKHTLHRKNRKASLGFCLFSCTNWLVFMGETFYQYLLINRWEEDIYATHLPFTRQFAISQSWSSSAIGFEIERQAGATAVFFWIFGRAQSEFPNQNWEVMVDSSSLDVSRSYLIYIYLRKKNINDDQS